MVFNKQFRYRKDAEGEMKVLSNTPVCMECANYIQANMLMQYLDHKNRDESDEEKEDGKGIINRVYNRVKQMKFM